jgi:hypothetical protein
LPGQSHDGFLSSGEGLAAVDGQGDAGGAPEEAADVPHGCVERALEQEVAAVDEVDPGVGQVAGEGGGRSTVAAGAITPARRLTCQVALRG